MLHKQKSPRFHWAIWLPYPSSWLRALILVPIAFPGARLIFFIYAGATLSAIRGSHVVTIFLLVLIGSLIPAILLAFPYHFFWFIWHKKTLDRWFAWLPCWSSLWEGFYATVVIGLSFLLIITLSRELWGLSCQSPHEIAEEISRCVGRATGRAAKAIFSNTDNIWNFDGFGVITKQRDSFVVKPWFISWLIIAAYLYQIEYIFRQYFIPKLKIVFKKPKSVYKTAKVDDIDVELNLLRGEMGLTQMKPKSKSVQINMDYSTKQQKHRKL